MQWESNAQKHNTSKHKREYMDFSSCNKNNEYWKSSLVYRNNCTEEFIEHRQQSCFCCKLKLCAPTLLIVMNTPFLK